ncbi:tetratricopeptide repeat protein [Flavobacterium sp. CSZ]|uniref:tetratricopeptide repeat protein n=1 Tax=Flavobacterium sp. CSZ TaxID=2783791 RepID=UPI00188D6BFF|nr:tetratricopeptide repeat protein [Flavobacterium sp. CSZ]MBF4484059.1 tetratricopeptide repeat protein [Flavobacterium sp. CSZ]
MKLKTLLLFLFISSAYAQNQSDAEKLINEGVVLHDKGDYSAAIDKYSKALEVDKDNLLALSEKAMSLNSAGKYVECIEVSKHAILTHSNEDLKNVYVSYANALDHLKKTDEALAIYQEGIQKYPNYYQLQFNKGICYTNSNRYNEAILCFQKSLLINPRHAGSLNAIGILEMKDNRIPAILAFSRFLIVEPQTSRSTKNLENIKKLLAQGIQQTGKKSITININSNVLSDSTSSKKENDFSQADLILSMASGLDFDKKNAKKTEVENFIRKFEVICSSLQETKNDNFGFYWENFAPYFIEMKNKKFIEAFAYIAYVDSGSEDVAKWHKKNQSELDKFYNWSKDYNWKN